MAQPKWVGKWSGGRIREVQGRRVWMLEKMVGGRQYRLTLDSTTEDEAAFELELFLRNPVAYAETAKAPQKLAAEAKAKEQAERAKRDAAVHLDEVTLKPFLAYLAKKERSREYRVAVRNYLAAWTAALHGADLRTVKLQDLRRALSTWDTAEKFRIIALKSFTAWAREQGLLAPHEDATLALKVPPSIAAKAVRTKGYERSYIEAFYREIGSQVVRDVICLRAKTGLHDSEIARLAAGKGVLKQVDDPCGIKGTARFIHKNGRVHVLSLDAQAFAAAKRLQARGKGPTRHAVRESIGYAAKRLKRDPMHPGELRHSFVTMARNEGQVVKPTVGGVPLETVAAIVGHHTTQTTTKYYDGTEVPPMIVLPLKLRHPEDPLVLESQARARARVRKRA